MNYFPLVLTLLLISNETAAQLGFFEEYWLPKSIESIDYQPKVLSPRLPEMVVTIDMSDTIRKISPLVGGYNLNTYYGGKIFDKPDLLKRIQHLQLPFFRFPGGSGSNWYFWDRSKPNLPDDVDYMIIKDETVHISDQIKWGDIPGSDYLSLDNSYILRDSCNNEAIHVVNYPYARYGRSEDPVAQAAHYAADWVRYDNGRTQFWEIGNEIYGSWEPGYIIDTSRNLDGQPLKITGALYAQHCLVFLDSMRAAAAEIGASIKIGATLGFQESRADWDDPVIKILKEQVDFYIVHKYFGNRENAPVDEMFDGVEEFYQHKSHIDGLINKYCNTYVPLVITEWNTRYEGSQQNVSCANGMHTMLGLKGIINEGFGLSCKWNLIWGYSEGNTHGLISGEKDNPAVEGIPKFYPRAPYFYHYYFKKILGDVSVGNQVSGAAGIEAFSSSFNTGQAATVLLNKTAVPRNVVVNIDNYSYGERFYWYLLEPENGQAFARKVKVNGQTNPGYDAGGPDNFDEIPAYGAESSGGIRIELPPYSTAFVIAEGSKMTTTTSHQITFNVYGNDGQTINPLQKAVVRIGKRMYIANEEGSVTIDVPSGTVAYELLANGFVSVSGSIEVLENVSLTDTLNFVQYTVDLTFSDADSDLPVLNCEVSLAGQTGFTDQNGKISFSGILYGDYLVHLRSDAYKEDITIAVFSDTVLHLALDSTEYQVEFLVLDKVSKDPVNTVMINWLGTIIYTNLDGKAQIAGYFGNYDYTASKLNYHPFTGNLLLTNDTLVTVLLPTAFADIKFKIYDGTVPVNGVKVILNDQKQNSNALGICTFSDLQTETNYEFRISREEYSAIDGELLLLTDTTVAVNYQDITNEVEIQLIDRKKGFVLPGSQVLLDGNFRQTDQDGKAAYTMPVGEYELSASSNRYHDTALNISITRDTLYQLPMDLRYAIIQFTVLFEEQVQEGASVTIGERTSTTNSLGVAVFNDLLVDATYDYQVSKEGMGVYNGSIEIFHDSILLIDLVELSSRDGNPAEIRVYPLPVSEELNIDSDQEMEEIVLYDYSGRVVYRRTGIAASEHRINVESLNAGLYFLRLKYSVSGHFSNIKVLVKK